MTVERLIDAPSPQPDMVGTAVQICYQRHTGKPLGYAVVHFDNPAAAQYAIDMLHNAEVDGRHIVVAPYRPRVSDATALKASPRPPSRPAANEAVALVMDLNTNATWMYASSCAVFRRRSLASVDISPIVLDCGYK